MLLDMQGYHGEYLSGHPTEAAMQQEPPIVRLKRLHATLLLLATFNAKYISISNWVLLVSWHLVSYTSQNCRWIQKIRVKDLRPSCHRSSV